MNKNRDVLLFEQITRMKMLSGEMLNEEQLNEIDWENDFSDVIKTCIDPKEFANYLNEILINYEKKPKDREKLKLDKPYIHNKTIKRKVSGEIDVDEFIKNITQIPPSIISDKNAKMKKSSDENQISLTIGVPALRGLVYDIEYNKIYYINTCPGAGACAVICYARKGNFVRLPNVFLKQTRVLNLLLNDPDKFEKILERELEIFAIKNQDKLIEFRWNDAGDFFSKKYVNIALNITKKLKSSGYNFNSYAYTKMGDVINLKDPDMVVNFSMDANKRELGKVKNMDKIKKAETVPEKLFADVFVKDAKNRNFLLDDKGKPIYKDENGPEILKSRIGLTYRVDPTTILTYDELLNTPEGEPLQYNVMIAPKGEGDIGAQRSDVQYSFLMFH